MSRPDERHEEPVLPDDVRADGDRVVDAELATEPAAGPGDRIVEVVEERPGAGS